MLHEPFHTLDSGPVGVGRARADFILHIESQAFLGAAAQVMQVAADGPQKFFCPGEQAYIPGRQHAKVLQVLHGVDAVEIFGDPE